MAIIDPTDPKFDVANLTGDELLGCPTCGSNFKLDYADAIINGDAFLPSSGCCREMLKAYIEKAGRHFADNLVVSDDPIFRAAGVSLRNFLSKDKPGASDNAG